MHTQNHRHHTIVTLLSPTTVTARKTLETYSLGVLPHDRPKYDYLYVTCDPSLPPSLTSSSNAGSKSRLAANILRHIPKACPPANEISLRPLQIVRTVRATNGKSIPATGLSFDFLLAQLYFTYTLMRLVVISCLSPGI